MENKKFFNVQFRVDEDGELSVLAEKITKLLPTKILFNINKKSTVVFWEDGTKTTVSCSDDEKFVEEFGVAMCVVNKVFGNRTKFLKHVRKGIYQTSTKSLGKSRKLNVKTETKK